MFRNYRKQKVYTIEIQGIEIEVSRKRIKNLYLRVNRRNGKVRVSCPHSVSEKGLYTFIESRMDWLRKNQRKAFSISHPPVLSYETGEKHLFLGKKYQLIVIADSSKGKVEIRENSMYMRTRRGTGPEGREKLLNDWYRAYLKERVPQLIRKYEPLMGVEVNEFGIRRMKTRWGTCNVRKKRIWLNLELAKRSPRNLEMVVVHEMVHLLERLHNKRFYNFMDKFFPEWRTFEEELNSTVD